MNIVIPMAGLGSRFARAGYTIPKPLIPIHGIPMIQLVVNNIRPARPHRFIFICQNEHILEHSLSSLLEFWAPGCVVVGIDGVTQGAACTVLCAKQYFDNAEHLMIANSDQFIECDINAYIAHATSTQLDGCIMTMKANDPKWSFLGLNSYGYVSKVVEKEVISDDATVGIYNFTSGKDFILAAEKMISKDIRVNNEFYVAPVYNEMIAANKTIGAYSIGSDSNGMHGLGTPEDLNLFLKNPLSLSATRGLNEDY